MPNVMVDSTKNFLRETNLGNFNFAGIYWVWKNDPAAIKSAIQNFSIGNDTTGTANYKSIPHSVLLKSFSGDSDDLRNKMVWLFRNSPTLFKVIYKLNKETIIQLKIDWNLRDQGVEMIKLLNAAPKPYEQMFEQHYKTHTEDGADVFVGEWYTFKHNCDSLYSSHYNDLEHTYDQWRRVRSMSNKQKEVLRYLITDYNNITIEDLNPDPEPEVKKTTLSDLFK